MKKLFLLCLFIFLPFYANAITAPFDGAKLLGEWVLYVNHGRQISADKERHDISDRDFRVEISTVSKLEDGRTHLRGYLSEYPESYVTAYINPDGTASMHVYIYLAPAIRKFASSFEPRFIFAIAVTGFADGGGIEGQMDAVFYEITDEGRWIPEVKYHSDASVYRGGKGLRE